MSGVPYTFASATSSIPLSQLDANFATNATLGNATVGLGNTTTTVGNLTLQNVTIASVASAITPAEGGTGLTSFTANGVVYASSTSALATGPALTYSNGNLGVGGTASNGAIEAIAPTNGITYFASTTYYNVSKFGSRPDTSVTYIGSSSYPILLNTESGQPIQFNINSSEKMRLTSAGYLGIGDTSPGAKLTVNDSSSLDTISLILRNNYNNYPTGYTGSVSLLAQGYSYGYNNNYNTGKIQFAIDNSFNTPSWQTSMRFYTSPAGTAVGTISEVARFESGGGYFLIGYTSSNGSYKLQVNSQIFATSSTIATSDGRYKTNVQNITDALSMVCALRPVSFNWMKHDVHNFDLSTPTVGFIAQEVQQALADKPFLNSIVKKNEYVVQQEVLDNTGKVIQPKVTEEFLGIAEGNLISILAQAIKEQQALIQNQTQTIQTLQTTLTNQQSAITALQQKVGV